MKEKKRGDQNDKISCFFDWHTNWKMIVDNNNVEDEMLKMDKVFTWNLFFLKQNK